MPSPGDSAPSLSSVSIEPAPPEPEPPGRLAVAVVEECGDWSAFPAREDAVRAAAGALAGHPRFRNMAAAEACVVLADNALVQSLNRTYRGKDTPTNVLSFPFRQMPAAEACPDADEQAEPASSQLGDVVLAAETVLREAAEQNMAPEHHLQHLVVHGLLHLLGLDHETEAQAEVMEGLEVEILASLGIADPYAAAACGEE